jgi:signal transduction histidine kinase
MIRHLYLRIYLTTLGALAIVVASCALLWEFIAQRPNGVRVLSHLHADAMQVHLHGLGIIMLIALAVAAAMYPLVRRLTRQLESLAGGVERFGRGDLASRVTVSGGDEVSRLAASFNTMADRVSHLLDAHARMLANASHELRSPLARIQLALALHDRTPDAALLQGIRQDCAEIDDHIEEILLASKLDTVGTPLLEHVDLAVLVAEESARLGLPFDVQPAEVRGDTRLLRRALRNLLENALKYGQTQVEALVFIAPSGCRVVQVRDRGPGIAEPERERIFEPFYRPADAGETGSGWGLGLALVRQITTQHGGSVRCLPRADGGCIFEATFPRP